MNKETSKGANAKLTKKARILKLLAAGRSIAEVAKAVKVNAQYVYYIRWMDLNAKNTKQSKVIEAVEETKAALDAIEEKQDWGVALTFSEHPVADPVNHPPHYKSGGIETIDFIEAKDLNYRLGNVVKYVSRAGRKNSDPIEDLQKAAWYLNREIEARKRA